MKPIVIFITGPTSSGKSAVSVGLAERLNGEIISCDSMQVYKDMDILAQVPSKEFLSRVKHHLIKIIPPEEEFNAARFVEKAQNTLKDIISKGKIPIVVGGTGLYMKSLLDGIFTSPPKSNSLREELAAIAREKGPEYLYEKLKKIDPETSVKLHPNDVRRIIRAIEVYELTGKVICDKKRESRGITDIYSCKLFGLSLPRNILYERINARVEGMFNEGLVDEVRCLNSRTLSLTSEKALGIKEVRVFLDGKIGLDEAKELLKKNTRRYAKRQLTWFRGDKRIVWIDANRSIEEIVNLVGSNLRGSNLRG